MNTKPAVRSTELWIVFVNILVFAGSTLFTDPAFIEFGKENIPAFGILSMAVLGFLRLYKTKTKIKGIFGARNKVVHSMQGGYQPDGKQGGESKSPNYE